MELLFDLIRSPVTLAIIVGVTLLVLGGRRLSERLSEVGFRTGIEMDGATCLKANDGGVVIRRRIQLYKWWVVVILALLGLPFVPSEYLILVSVILGAALLKVALPLVPSLRQPSIIHFNAKSRILEIGHGTTGQQILFSGISHIKTIPPTRSIFEDVTRIRIQVMLDNGEVIELGSVSGDANKAHTQAVAITQLVAKVTGAAIREPAESIIR